MTDTAVELNPKWQQEANCLGLDPMLFFPTRGEPPTDAKEVCRGCTVRAECLNFGLEENFGIWGGLSEQERRKIRSERHHERMAMK